ncbi:rubredoxin [Candidatus Magnetomonas plexicatena]
MVTYTTQRPVTDKKGKIPPGTKFENLPDDWRCPLCGVNKKFFKCIED